MRIQTSIFNLLKIFGTEQINKSKQEAETLKYKEGDGKGNRIVNFKFIKFERESEEWEYQSPRFENKLD